MTEKEKMLAGELYDCADKELMEIWNREKIWPENITLSLMRTKKAKIKF